METARLVSRIDMQVEEEKKEKKEKNKKETAEFDERLWVSLPDLGAPS